VLVLIAAMIVAVLGLSSLLVSRVHLQQVEEHQELVQSRFSAESAIELAHLWMQENGDWRQQTDSLYLLNDTAFADGLIRVELDDPIDGDLADSECDPVAVTGIGLHGVAKRLYQVRLEPVRLELAIGALDPITYWPLSETGGTTAHDAAGIISGAYRNDVSLADDEYHCRPVPRFDGSSDFVEIPHSSIFLLDAGSILLWFRPQDAGGEQGLISKDSTGFDTGGHFTLLYRFGRLRARLQSQWFSEYLESGVLVPHKWHQVCVTFGPQGYRMYADGELVEADGYSGGLGTSSGGYGNFEPWTIGVEQTNSGDLSSLNWSNPFEGHIAHVAIFDTQLSEDEVEYLYDVSNGVVLEPLTGSWQRLADTP
jgi:hypothetical protein